MSKDYFKHKAGQYEQSKKRVANVEAIARAILEQVNIDPSMQIMDFGSGTGLLLERIAPHVKKVTAVDISSAMNQQLRAKKERLGCELDMLEMDLSKTPLDRKFDGIISSMTMHHIEDIPAMLATFQSLLNKGGFIALADLETEDGSFHTEDTGVFHHGFDPEACVNLAVEAKFSDVKTLRVSTIDKPHGQFPVFLLTGINA